MMTTCRALLAERPIMPSAGRVLAAKIAACTRRSLHAPPPSEAYRERSAPPWPSTDDRLGECAGDQDRTHAERCGELKIGSICGVSGDRIPSFVASHLRGAGQLRNRTQSPKAC